MKQLPTIPQSFINKYIKRWNEGKKIEKCMVEYTCKTCNDEGEIHNGHFNVDCPNCYYKNNNPILELKLINNEIIIREEEEKLYTKADMRHIAKHMFVNGLALDDEHLSKFDKLFNQLMD
jgi:hypothetical protein